MRILPVEVHQVVVRAVLEDLTVSQHRDLVCHTHGREAVRDQDRDLLVGQFSHAIKDLRFGLGVHRRGGFIEDQDIRVLSHERPGERDLLPLPARELPTILEPAAELRLVAIVHLFDELRRHPLTRGVLPTIMFFEGVDITHADVLSDGELIPDEVLEDDADALLELVDVPLVERQPIEHDASLARHVQPREELDQRRLARAILTDQGELLAGREVQVHAFERPSLLTGVLEPDVLEAQAILWFGANDASAISRWCGLLEELVERR